MEKVGEVLLQSLPTSPLRLKGPLNILLEVNTMFSGIQEVVVCYIKFV